MMVIIIIIVYKSHDGSNLYTRAMMIMAYPLQNRNDGNYGVSHGFCVALPECKGYNGNNGITFIRE